MPRPRRDGGLPSRLLWYDAFVVRRHPVTHGEWLAFVNALASEDAERYLPAELAPDGTTGAPLYVRTDAGWALPEDGPWTPDCPVSLIDWDSAMAYAAHVGADGRLVDELEWEKMARGVDGRPWPFGWNHDPSWVCTAESHAGPPGPHPVSAFPADESPYGVRGLTRGIRDWCFNAFVPTGPDVIDDVVVVAGPEDGSGPRITRGGAWSLPDWVGRICCRGFHPPIRLPDLGMRLARSAP